MPYVIKRQEDGRYVAAPGSAHSYTGKLEAAQTFPSRQEAERNACGNESVHDVADILRPH